MKTTVKIDLSKINNPPTINKGAINIYMNTRFEGPTHH